MPGSLELNLLGPIEIRQNGQSVTQFFTGKTLALMCYLAVTRGPHSRSALAGLLWADMPEDHARANLSKALSTLHELLSPHFTITRQTVVFNRASKYWSDIEAFELGIQDGSVEALRQAEQLYRGHFLDGLQVRNAPEFELWALGQQTRLRDMIVQALYTLSAHFETQGAVGWATAINYTSRLLHLEPWREEAHRQMMRLLAMSGQRGAALAQFRTCREVLEAELGVEPGAETVALYEQIRDDRLVGSMDETILFTPAAGPVTIAPLHNLPATLTPFLGRESELQQLDHLLAEEDIRLISIAGIGGMGKTRLALEAARRQIGHFQAGIFFVSLIQVDSPDNIPGAIADTIGFHFYSAESPLQQLVNYLRNKQMLLILDNFEHLVSGGAVVAYILTAAPEVKILVTSREHLRLHGETRLNLSGMEVEHWPTVAEACQASVMKLLVQSAQRVRPDFKVDDDNLQAAADICRRMEGLPLGVEMAASWANVMTLEEILAAIDAGAADLVSDFQDTPPRHQSLRNVLEQSLNLLGAGEREVFLRLCVFRGGFTRDAARRVAGADMRTLTTMVNKVLVQRDSGGRFAIHELLRQFGETSLNSDEESATRVRNEHAHYYCDYLGGLDAELNLGDATLACRQIELELGNVHVAWDWACQRGMFECLIEAEYPIFLFREYANRFEEMEQMYQTAIRHLTARDASPQRDFVLSSVLRSRAWTALRFGQIEQGLELARQSWDFLLKSEMPLRTVSGNDPRAPLTVLYTLSGNFDLARQNGEEMLAHHRSRDDGVKAILAYYALSTLEIAEGHYERVLEYGRSAQEYFEATGHRYLWSYCLNNWGNAERALGHLDEAKRLFLESYGHMRDLGSTEGMTTALNNIAQIAIHQGEYDNARVILERNVATYRNLGDIGGIAMTLEGLGNIALHQGDYAQAAQLFGEALQTSGTSLPGLTLSILTGIGRLFLEAGRSGQGERMLLQVSNHPAANQEIRNRTRQVADACGMQMADAGEDFALSDLLAGALQQLKSHDWHTLNAPQ